MVGKVVVGKVVVGKVMYSITVKKTLVLKGCLIITKNSGGEYMKKT